MDAQIALENAAFNVLYLARKWAEWTTAGKPDEAAIYLHQWESETLRYWRLWVKDGARL